MITYNGRRGSGMDSTLEITLQEHDGCTPFNLDEVIKINTIVRDI